MNKAIFLFTSVLLLLVSCSEKKSRESAETLGKINSVAVIVDDQLWNGEVGDSLRNKFASPVLGLPQEEPIFSLNQYPVKLLEGFMSNSRNIIVIKKEAKSRFEIVKNEYANPQIVVHISGKSVQELQNSIQANDSLIVKTIKDSEINTLQNLIKKDSLQSLDKIIAKFNVKLAIPNKYKMVMLGKQFMWYKKEITSGSLSLILYQIPLSSISNDKAIDRFTKIRDSIGTIYIHGAVPRTRMITEPAFSPYFSKTKIFGKETYETKGNWELKYDSMSGPFINYAMVDRANNRILVIEGFCYAPSKQKRDFMFELEAIIKSVQFLKKK